MKTCISNQKGALRFCLLQHSEVAKLDMLIACGHQVSRERHSCVSVCKQSKHFFVVVCSQRIVYVLYGRCVLQQFFGYCETEEKEFDDLMISFPFLQSAGLKHEWHMSEFPRLLGK
jgi:hypothetical protein